MMMPENEYGRLLTAGRIFFTTLVTGSVLSLITMLSVVRKHGEIFENMVSGGIEAMPPLTRILISYAWSIAAVPALLMIWLLYVVWRTPRLSTIIWAAAGLSIWPMIQTFLIQSGILDPLNTVITKFQE